MFRGQVNPPYLPSPDMEWASKPLSEIRSMAAKNAPRTIGSRATYWKHNVKFDVADVPTDGKDVEIIGRSIKDREPNRPTPTEFVVLQPEIPEVRATEYNVGLFTGVAQAKRPANVPAGVIFTELEIAIEQHLVKLRGSKINELDRNFHVLAVSDADTVDVGIASSIFNWIFGSPAIIGGSAGYTKQKVKSQQIIVYYIEFEILK